MSAQLGGSCFAGNGEYWGLSLEEMAAVSLRLLPKGSVRLYSAMDCKICSELPKTLVQNIKSRKMFEFWVHIENSVIRCDEIQEQMIELVYDQKSVSPAVKICQDEPLGRSCSC